MLTTLVASSCKQSQGNERNRSQVHLVRGGRPPKSVRGGWVPYISVHCFKVLICALGFMPSDQYSTEDTGHR